ncbi:MAG: hypothetical protein J6U54_01245 [Clostridiales bacterium]|nr:hypothetical protein [Clostridiales bacterium]
MTLREYMNKTAAVDQLIALNNRAYTNHGVCLSEILGYSEKDKKTKKLSNCIGDCNKCMVELLDKEVSHGT